VGGKVEEVGRGLLLDLRMELSREGVGEVVG
jgi:hypothetical protein